MQISPNPSRSGLAYAVWSLNFTREIRLEVWIADLKVTMPSDLPWASFWPPRTSQKVEPIRHEVWIVGLCGADGMPILAVRQRFVAAHFP